MPPPPQKNLKKRVKNAISNISPAFSCYGCNLHLAFMCFREFQRCIFIIVSILPLFHCYFLFNVDFFRELFWFYFIRKVAGGYVHNSRGKSPAPGPRPPALSDSPGKATEGSRELTPQGTQTICVSGDLCIWYCKVSGVPLLSLQE